MKLKIKKGTETVKVRGQVDTLKERIFDKMCTLSFDWKKGIYTNEIQTDVEIEVKIKRKRMHWER